MIRPRLKLNAENKVKKGLAGANPRPYPATVEQAAWYSPVQCPISRGTDYPDRWTSPDSWHCFQQQFAVMHLGDHSTPMTSDDGHQFPFPSIDDLPGTDIDLFRSHAVSIALDVVQIWLGNTCKAIGKKEYWYGWIRRSYFVEMLVDKFA